MGTSTEEQEDIPRLRDLTSARQSWLDNEQDATDSTANPTEVGKRFGARWSNRASPEQAEALLLHRPILPRNVDGELLRYAARVGIDTWEDDAPKFAVRAGFWEALGLETAKD